MWPMTWWEQLSPRIQGALIVAAWVLSVLVVWES